MPSSVQLGTYPKAELTSDFRSRVRLAIPRKTGSGETPLLDDLAKLRSLVAGKNADGAAENAAIDDEIFATVRHLGAVFGEVLKRKASEHKRELLLACSLASRPVNPSERFSELSEAINHVDRLIDSQREIVNMDKDGHTPLLQLLDQYVHHLYVEYLNKVRSEFDRLVSEDGLEGRKKLLMLFNRLQAKEAKRLADRLNTQRLLENETERELHLLRQSQLKKFFQSDMFVDVTRRESLKKFTEPAATTAAGVAAVIGAMVERFAKPHGGHLGGGELFLLTFGVMLYILKDRFKDRSKAFFTSRISKVIPDLEQELVAEGNKVGFIKEWFRTAKRSSLAKRALDLRAKAAVSQAEKHLPEDVLHYRRAFELKSVDASSHFCLQESLRINLQRYLKHMDDPYKSIHTLDAKGKFAHINSHRVYHFHVCMTATVEEKVGSRRGSAEDYDAQVSHIFRIVMDKNGIDRVERVD